ncbi:MAG: protein-methionine-sulfoxide reductase catalytic subunit MsrP, partial [Acidobacteriota bacterium]|nr:protein-methionine-sulfoxide reductase catalytic subunit MsrP [Acidobacteriota bacterium]
FASKFEVDPWKMEIGGLCSKPQTLDLDDIFAIPHEERLYHFRCVERWAMNVPWSGFPLKTLIDRADPKPSAKYVRFETVLRKDQMPGVEEAHWYPWPYHEALRIDEARNELAFMATGVYGEPLLRQHGSPIRVLAPWKYGYKNPKSIVKIDFVEEEPKTFWQIQAHEYGFLSNVNPFIPHPRWSQAHSYWLHNRDVFETPMYNGYDSYVADLYADEPRELQKPLTQGQVAR